MDVIERLMKISARAMSEGVSDLLKKSGCEWGRVTFGDVQAVADSSGHDAECVYLNYLEHIVHIPEARVFHCTCDLHVLLKHAPQLQVWNDPPEPG